MTRFMNLASLARTTVVVLLTGALLLSSAFTQTAKACSCVLVTQFVAPLQGAQDVPTNARLWVRVNSFDVDSMVVSLEPSTVTLGPGRDIVLAGREILRSYSMTGLEAGASYKATIASGGFGQVTVDFRVAAADSVTPPPIPTLTSCEEDKETESLFGGISSCGEWHKVDITARAPQAAVMLALREGDGVLDEVAMTGKVTAAANLFDGVQRFYMGNAPCGPVTWNVDEGSTTVRVGSYDITGKFSGWSGANTVVAGCEGGLGASGSLWMLALGILWWVRRQRVVA